MEISCAFNGLLHVKGPMKMNIQGAVGVLERKIMSIPRIVTCTEESGKEDLDGKV